MMTMIYEVVLTWCMAHRRDPGYLADLCGMTPEHLRDLACGKTVPTEAEWAMLSEVMGIPVEDMKRGAEGPRGSVRGVDPAQCYSAADMAKLVGASVDTVYGMMADSRLYWISVGDRLKKVPHFAMIGFLMGYPWEVQRMMASPPHSHFVPDGQTVPQPQSSGDSPPPPRVPPERGKDDGTTEPRLPL